MALPLIACAPPAPEQSSIPFAFDQQGIALLDRPQRIDFGRTGHSAVSAMSKLKASSPTQERQCDGLREVSWSGGERLYFDANVFRGWSFNERSAGQTCL